MEKEIIILTDTVAVDGKNKKSNVWIGEINIIAWKDTSLHIENKKIKWITTYDELVEISNTLKKNMIAKIIVEEENEHFSFREILEAPTEDSELKNIQQKNKKSIYYNDKNLGKFKFEKEFNWFTKKIQWDNDKGTVYINNSEPENLDLIFQQVNSLINEKWLKDIKEFASKELSPLTIEWSGKFFTDKELIQKISFDELIVDEQGNFTVFLSSTKIFKDHKIQVEGNIKTGINNAYL